MTSVAAGSPGRPGHESLQADCGDHDEQDVRPDGYEYSIQFISHGGTVAAAPGFRRQRRLRAESAAHRPGSVPWRQPGPLPWAARRAVVSVTGGCRQWPRRCRKSLEDGVLGVRLSGSDRHGGVPLTVSELSNQRSFVRLPPPAWQSESESGWQGKSIQLVVL